MEMYATRSSWDTLLSQLFQNTTKSVSTPMNQRCVARPTLSSLTGCLTVFVHIVCLVIGLCESHLIFAGTDDEAKCMIMGHDR